MPFGKEEIRTEVDINPSICFSGLKTVIFFSGQQWYQYPVFVSSKHWNSVCFSIEMRWA